MRTEANPERRTSDVEDKDNQESRVPWSLFFVLQERSYGARLRPISSSNSI